jgi:AraC family transcriptional regulator
VGQLRDSVLTAVNSDYIARIDRVIDHLRAHLDRPVRLDELARVAGFSEFHFHRIFGAVTGETVNVFANRARIEKAARLLRYSDRSATDIAFDCGFSSSAAFSRAFRAAYDTTPSRFRRKGEVGESKIRKEPFPELDYRLPMSVEEQRAAFPVRVVDLPERRIAYLRVVNAFEGGRVLAAFGEMVAWARREGILEEGTLFGMSIDDPHVTPRPLYRYEVCFASSSPFVVAEGMSTVTLPAMRYAIARVSGDLRRVATAWDYLFRGWLIHSAYEPEHAPAIEVFLDKEAATDWSHFDLDLCVPIRTLARTGG